jgi:glutaminyl-peptide cyclotransferase
MRKVLGAMGAAITLAACVGADAQKPAPAPSAPSAPKFDSGRAWEHLRRQVSFGPRPSGSAANAETRRYILEQLRAAGIEGQEQPFEAHTPTGPVKMANVVATIPGSRPDRIAFGTHFDTKLERRFRFVGASDGASSTAAVLELGRVLNARKNTYTIELLFFDGEEAVVAWTGNDHTYGSRHYVQAAKKAGTLGGLKALILLDLIGDRDLRIRRESNSTRWLTDVIWATAASLGYRRYFIDEEFSVGGDDHFEFLAAGVPAVDIIDLDYAAWHTAQDDLDAVSARSLQIVGDVVLEALPRIEQRLSR